MNIRQHTDTLANVRQKAYEVAYLAHHFQVDKGGMAYLEHVKRVANKVTEGIPWGYTEHEQLWATAMLHDVMEDSRVLTLSDLYFIFGTTVGDAVVAITHMDGEKYWDYMDRVSHNELATRVKVADIRDNLDIDRALKVLRYGTTTNYIRLVEVLIPRYLKALEFLNV